MLSACDVQLPLLALRFGPLSTMQLHAALHHCLSTRMSSFECALSIADTQMIVVVRSQLGCRLFHERFSSMRLDFNHKCASPLRTRALTHSMIDVIMSAFASPASVARGPLPIHRDILLRAASLSHR